MREFVEGNPVDHTEARVGSLFENVDNPGCVKCRP